MGVLTKDTGTMSKEPWPSACGIHISPISAASQLKKVVSNLGNIGKHSNQFFSKDISQHRKQQLYIIIVVSTRMLRWNSKKLINNNKFFKKIC